MPRITGRSIGAAILFALVGTILQAARPYQPVEGDPMREPWRWRSFAEMNGLETQCVIEGAGGVLWFGTMEGASSYDGFSWTRHLAGENQPLAGWVAAMCVEPDGTLDAAGWWGISQFRAGEWTRLVPQIGVKFADVRRMALAPDGSLWAATSWGALRRTVTGWQLYTDAVNGERLRHDDRYRFLTVVVWPDTIRTRGRPTSLPTNRADLTEVAVAPDGRVWFGTKGGELLVYAPPEPARSSGGSADGGSGWTMYNEDDGLTSGRRPSILPLRDGGVWVVVTAARQVSVFDHGRWNALPIPEPGVETDGCRLLQTRDGAVWVSARYVLFAYRNGTWSTYRTSDTPIPAALNLLVQSSDGALWITGPSTDIQRVDYQTSRWLTLEDLNFQWESPAGVQWFLHRDGRVVVRDGERWTSYGVEDGLMDAAVVVLGGSDGTVWAAGSHEHVAATARFDGKNWSRQVHSQFSWGIDPRAAYAASDGSVWFGAMVDSSGPTQHRDGLLQFRAGAWVHHHQPGRSPGGTVDPMTVLPPSHRPEPIEKFSVIGETRDGRIWAGRNVLAVHDAQGWNEVFPTDQFRFGIIEAMLTTRDRDLWIGTRQFGALRYDGTTWQFYPGTANLLANSVRSLAETADGSIWAATDRGFSRFDGTTWMSDALAGLPNPPYDGGNLKASPSGKLWLNRFTPEWNRRAWAKSPPVTPAAPFWTVGHQFRGPSPRTVITAGATRIAQPGNISILWRGEAPWRGIKEARLQYSFRLDGGPWSAFTSEHGHAFFTLPSGRHHFEVRTRDEDFNVDPTPAALDFVVLPPVWQQPWFIGLILILGALLGTQTFRVLLEKRRLQMAQAELEDRVRQRTAELEITNRELEAFSYSVSHDLRAPLRSIDGFSRALLEDYDAKLDDEGRQNLRYIRGATQRMARLIDALLGLSRVTRGTLRFAPVNLSAMAEQIAAELARAHPEHHPNVIIAPDVVAVGDAALLHNVLQNLLGNAWKFTANSPQPKIEFGVMECDGERVYFVRDNGAGFDRAMAKKLFGAFQRFHAADEFPGTGIGLATVQRIIHRHGGRVDAQSRPGEGALFTFTLPRQTGE